MPNLNADQLAQIESLLDVCKKSEVAKTDAVAATAEARVAASAATAIVAEKADAEGAAVAADEAADTALINYIEIL
jgi:hypothetical protein